MRGFTLNRQPTIGLSRGTHAIAEAMRLLGCYITVEN